LRVEGYFALDAVEYALYEAEGTFSALPKKNYQEMQTSLPIVLIAEGKFDEKNVEFTQHDKSFYVKLLQQQGCKDIEKILIMTVDGNGKVYFQKKGEKYQTMQLNWDKTLW
jgi:uncharacterized membrane protein YcaP (DUF421 family)